MIGAGDARLPDGATSNGRSAFREVDSRTLLAFVRAGLGAALVLELAIESDDQSVVALPVADAIPPQEVVLVTHRFESVIHCDRGWKPRQIVREPLQPNPSWNVQVFWGFSFGSTVCVIHRFPSGLS